MFSVSPLIVLNCLELACVNEDCKIFLAEC